MSMRWMPKARAIAWAILMMTAASMRADAAEPTIDLNLVLAVDVSSSVDASRFELQKNGYTSAFRDPKVIRAIRAGSLGKIAVTLLYWTDPDSQLVAVPWMLIKDQASANAVADAIAATQRPFNGSTSVGAAISRSTELMATSPYVATRKVIDISGDGSNNFGPQPKLARDAAVQAGIRINGLPILSVEDNLDVYYKQNVIGGPGSFVIAVKSYDVFSIGILRKLITEISQDQPHTKLALK